MYMRAYPTPDTTGETYWPFSVTQLTRALF